MADATNKIAIVTGAGTGVGRAASLALMNAGFTVVLAGRRMEMLEETKKLGDNVGKSLCVSADMTDPGSIAALFAKVMETYGRLDVLFNNAGMGAPPVNFEDLSLEQWQAVVNTNLTGPFLCTQHAFRIMKDQNPRGGRIINNGSISAHAPRPFSAAYTSTKHAITGLTKATNLDGRMYDIAVGQVDIGNAATPDDRPHGRGPGVMQPDGTMKHEPRMDAKAVGDAVAYMASLPLDANVLFMTVMASKMPFVGRGYAAYAPQAFAQEAGATPARPLGRDGGDRNRRAGHPLEDIRRCETRSSRAGTGESERRRPCRGSRRLAFPRAALRRSVQTGRASAAA